MPLYEYYCGSCDGVFEQLRSIRESDEPYPCPECNREAGRIMPTSFNAFTMRDGYPRRIPDRGTYWHLGKEVKRPINVAAPAGQHPDLYKPDPTPTPSKGDQNDMADALRQDGLRQYHAAREKAASIERKVKKTVAKSTKKIPK